MTDQVTSMSRTFSTSIIQREVIHAQGQAGSKNNSADRVVALAFSVCAVMPPIVAPG